MIGRMQAYWLARKRWLHGKTRSAHYITIFFDLLYGNHISEMTEIGEGTQLGYNGIGCVIHNNCKIGEYCIISQNVTLGGRDNHNGVPVLGNHVKIGAGAVVLGGVKIGDFAEIGANAVVLRDIPPYSVAVGIPAVIIQQKKRKIASGGRTVGSN